MRIVRFVSGGEVHFGRQIDGHSQRAFQIDRRNYSGRIALPTATACRSRSCSPR